MSRDVHSCSPSQRIWTFTRALLVSKDTRHLFVTPWFQTIRRDHWPPLSGLSGMDNTFNKRETLLVEPDVRVLSRTCCEWLYSSSPRHTTPRMFTIFKFGRDYNSAKNRPFLTAAELLFMWWTLHPSSSPPPKKKIIIRRRPDILERPSLVSKYGCVRMSNDEISKFWGMMGRECNREYWIIIEDQAFSFGSIPS